MSFPSVDTIPSFLKDTVGMQQKEQPTSTTTTPTTTTTSLAAKYRGAVIADLDLPPALSVAPTTPVSEALAMSYDRSYDQLTVINPENRSLLGYLSIPRLKSLLQSGQVKEDGTVSSAMNKFRKGKGVEYQVITPDTGLDELETFLTKGRGQDCGFAVVTDSERKFVLGVVTKEDLDMFAKRRG